MSETIGAAYDTTAPQLPKSLETTISASHVIVGEVISTTVTICVAVAVFPFASSAVHVTVVTPNGKTAGASLVMVTVPQSTDAVGVPKLGITASQLLLALTDIAAGAVIVTFGFNCILVTGNISDTKP